jgi:uracil-DNA glycosylase family 4
MTMLDDPTRAWSAEELRARLSVCRRCLDAGYDVVGPPLADRGPLPARIFLLGQAPAAVHSLDPTTRPFSPGRHGQPSPLWKWLEQAGWEEETFRSSTWMTAITRCYPGPAPTGSGDRRPTAREQALCGPYWKRELELAQPEVIITLGTMALHALGFRQARLREATGQVYDVRLDGRKIPVIPLPHPSGVSRWLNEPEHRALLERGLEELSRLTEHMMRRGDGSSIFIRRGS